MKLSVSVPDDVWMRACAAAATESPSEVVQTALRRFLSLEDPSLWDPGEEAQGRAAAIGASKRDEAKAHYTLGYEEGLKLGDHLDWETLDWAAELDFDLRRLNREIEGEYSGMWNPLEEVSFDREGLGRGILFERGVRAALRDVWRSVVEVLQDSTGSE